MRPPQDYEKVRRAIGWFLRNRQFQAARQRIRPIEYLNAGCGPYVDAGLINLDYRWVPGVDVVWDLDRPLPFPSARFRGIFSEHCLEHFDEPGLMAVLREFLRILLPSGRLRIVVPSLEIHARAYLASIDGETASGNAARAAGAGLAFNEVFYAGHDQMKRSHWRNDGHHFIHDRATLAVCLESAGFVDVSMAGFRQGADSRLLIDQPDRAWESLYMEAVKPAGSSSSR